MVTRVTFSCKWRTQVIRSKVRSIKVTQTSAGEEALILKKAISKWASMLIRQIFIFRRSWNWYTSKSKGSAVEDGIKLLTNTSKEASDCCNQVLKSRDHGKQVGWSRMKKNVIMMIQCNQYLHPCLKKVYKALSQKRGPAPLWSPSLLPSSLLTCLAFFSTPPSSPTSQYLSYFPFMPSTLDEQGGWGSYLHKDDLLI